MNSKDLDHGLYVIYWVSGGASLASVGSTYTGARWFAPCNWTSADPVDPVVTSTDWSPVASATLLVSVGDLRDHLAGEDLGESEPIRGRSGTDRRLDERRRDDKREAALDANRCGAMHFSGHDSFRCQCYHGHAGPCSPCGCVNGCKAAACRRL